MSDLFAKYFGHEEDDQPGRDEVQQERAMAILREMVSVPGWGILKDWLEGEIRENEVTTGVHAEMLTQVGFRSGLLHVKAKLEEVELSVKQWGQDE